MSNGLLLGSGGFATLPLAAGASRHKISDGSKALPVDRAFFTYHHFHNAMDVAYPNAVFDLETRSISNNRYTAGFEKTLFDEQASVEFRLPLSDEFDSGALGASLGAVMGGGVGNLGITYKQKIYETDRTVWAAGLGVSVPTGSDVVGLNEGDAFRIENDAVYLMPFVGWMATPSERRFYHAFLQVDVPVNGNRLTNLVNGFSDELREQTYLYADFTAGYWLYRCDSRCSFPCSKQLTGIASLLELHYTTTLENPLDPVVPGAFVVQPTLIGGSVDVLNLTGALHFEFGNQLALRVGGVVPLTDVETTFDDGTGFGQTITVRSPFDAELQASVIYRF